jgi:putative endonuclease
MSTETGWFVYLVRCNDGTFYTGITTNVERRVLEHNRGVTGAGAKYTASRRPVTLVYYEAVPDRSAAGVREYQLRKLSRRDKKRLCQA